MNNSQWLGAELRLAVALFFSYLISSSPVYSQELTLQERFGVSFPEQIVEFPYSGGPIDVTSTHLAGPDGQEVLFQQLAKDGVPRSGNVLVRTVLPASRQLLASRQYSNVDFQNDLIALVIGQSYQDGEPVQAVGTGLPNGLATNTNYFVKMMSVTNSNGSVSHGYALFRDPALTQKVDFTSYGNGRTTLIRQGWILDPRDASLDTLYIANHKFVTGATLKIRSTGALPGSIEGELSENTTYYAIVTSASTIKLARSRAEALSSAAIDINAPGDGFTSFTNDWQWKVTSGGANPPPTTNPVQLNSSDPNYYEISNGLTGIRVLKPSANPAPFTKVAIAGIRLAGSGNQWLPIDTKLSTSQLTFTNYTVNVIEQGPLRTTVEVRYPLTRTDGDYWPAHPITDTDTDSDTITLHTDAYYWHGQVTARVIKGSGGTLPCGLVENKRYWLNRVGTRTSLNAQGNPVVTDSLIQLSSSLGGPPVDLTCKSSGSVVIQLTQFLAGNGVFRQTFSLDAGNKGIRIEEESDGPISYKLNLYQAGAFTPTQARYRGHGAPGGTMCGYSLDANGAKQPYIAVNDVTQAQDAYVDLAPYVNRDLNYNCTSTTFKTAPIWYMASSGANTGYYWLMYDKDASAESPLIGYYLGRPSRLEGTIMNGPGQFTAAGVNQTPPQAGLANYFGFGAPDGKSTDHIQREWYLYVSTKGELKPTREIQTVNLEMNATSGINLTRLANYQLEFPEPSTRWPAPYVDHATFDRFKQKIKNDPAFASMIRSAGTDMTWLVDYVKGDPAAEREAGVSKLETFVSSWLNRLVNGAGIYDPAWHYYQPGLWWQPNITTFLVLMDEPGLSTEQRSRGKAAQAMVSNIFWDNDYVPWDHWTGEGTGNANQGGQYGNYRLSNALIIRSHPMMASKIPSAVDITTAYYHGYLNPISGAVRASTSYEGSEVLPMLGNQFLLLNSGAIRAEDYPLWNGYGRWLLSAMTPKEVRFGDYRKQVSVGDGNTQGTGSAGLMATWLRNQNPTLAAQLQWAWNAEGRQQLSAGAGAISSAQIIDYDAVQTQPQLKSVDINGYWSVLRHGFETPYETAAWFVNGDWYSDHRHNDAGQVSMYALNAPLSIDWNANLYYPHVGGGFQHNGVQLQQAIERELNGGTSGTRTWSSDAPGLDIGSSWGRASNREFIALANSTRASTEFVNPFGIWKREVTTIAPVLDHPAILVRDSFSGGAATASKILTWNLMAGQSFSTGEQLTDAPGGLYRVVERLNRDGVSKALPSNGEVRRMSLGLNRFHFTGQEWAAHPTQGINWDLIVDADSEQEFYLGSWGHDRHTNVEMKQYRAVNGTPFTEKQFILRIKGNSGFFSLFLPNRKGEAALLAVSRAECGLKVSYPTFELCIAASGYQLKSDSRLVIGSFGTADYSAVGITLRGGPTEVDLTPTSLRVSASGGSSTRSLTLPGTWSTANGVLVNGNTLTVPTGAISSDGVTLSGTWTPPNNAAPAPPLGLQARTMY